MHIENSEQIELVEFGGQKYFQGYAAVFYDPSNPQTVFKPEDDVEIVIDPTAFDEVLATSNMSEVWYNHNKDYVLGDTPLTKDAKGIKFSMAYDQYDVDHQKVGTKITKKIIKGCSFSAYAQYETQKIGSTYRRTLKKVLDLKEVSICNRPAFGATTVSIAASKDNEPKNLKKVLALADEIKNLLAMHK